MASIMTDVDLSHFQIHPDTLDFALPEGLIAQSPTPERDAARLMVLDRTSGQIHHRIFSEIGEFLHKGDLLVLNRARVNPAKVTGQKPTGGRVDVIFIGPSNKPGVWKALVRPFLKEDAEFHVGDVVIRMAGRTELGECLLDCGDADPRALMEKKGRVPLPPYIKREENDVRHGRDAKDYQTVYASVPGSIAAPTAGLHFSERLLQDLEKKGVQTAFMVLHVGWGTFRPIADRVENHEMMAERYEIPQATFEAVKRARAEKRRVIAVGTTSTRVLESLSPSGVTALSGETNLFIRPGFEFQWLSGLITNFHVPKSTPVALTAAFAGLPRLERAYRDAIKKGYRFFSYGDGMLIV